MYSIKAIDRTGEEYYVYRDDLQDETLKLNSPKLDLTENAAGQLTFKMPPNNIGYDKIDRITTEFVVNKNGNEVWRGRIISIKEDFFKNKNVTCEGELALLNDTTQPQELYENITLKDLLNKFLTYHNQKVGDEKRFYIGEFDYDSSKSVTNSYDEVYTNYDTTFKAINEKILNNSYGYIYLTKSNSRRVINHRAYVNRPYGSQVINFGKNLLDFTKDYDATQFATVVLPLGARLENKYGINMSGIDGVQAYTTVEDVNGGSMYVVNQTAVDNFGWIETVVNFDDTDDEYELLDLARDYLNNIQYDTMTLEVSAVDLSYLDVDVEELKLSDRVRVVSQPHGLDRYFPITKISIPLDNPAGTTYTMGDEGIRSLTTRTVKTNVNLENEIRTIPTQEEILNNAKNNAGNLISAFTRGFITITQRDNGSNELYITENPVPIDYNADNPASGVEDINRYWRWNFKGLEFVNKTKNRAAGRNENASEVAITMDGEINANMITTGVLNAGIITAGVLKNKDWGKGLNKDIFYLDLDEGILNINATSLSIGGASAATKTDITTASSTAATNAVNNLTGAAIYKKLTDMGGTNQGIYALNGKYYINAGYIRAGTFTIGGNDYGNGYLIVKNASNYTTHQISVDGLTSYGMNYTMAAYGGNHQLANGKWEYAMNYQVKYGKAGYLSDYDSINIDETGKKTSNRLGNTYYSNYIGYYRTQYDSEPFAFIGLKGNRSLNTGYQDLVLQNNGYNVNIGSSRGVSIKGGSWFSIDGGGNSSISIYKDDLPYNMEYDSYGNYYNGYVFSISVELKLYSPDSVETDSNSTSKMTNESGLAIRLYSDRMRYRNGEVYGNVSSTNKILYLNGKTIDKINSL